MRVVIEVGRGGFQPHLEFEYSREDMIEPCPRRRAAEQPIILRKKPPAGAAIRLCRAADGRQAEPVQGDPLAVEHAVDIMVGPQKQAGGVFERGIAWQTRPGRCGRAG